MRLIIVLPVLFSVSWSASSIIAPKGSIRNIYLSEHQAMSHAPSNPYKRSTNGQCGSGYGACSSTQCCSLEGWCGTGPAYCNAPDCQFAYGPACDANKIPPGTNTSTVTRKRPGNVLYGGDGIYDCVENGAVALTFDDGPSEYTAHILDLLDEYNATASFMITGVNNGKGEIDNSSLPWPGLIQRMYAAGHQICSHTWSHADLCTLTSAQRRDEMYKNEMALRNIISVMPTYMRPPYSSCTAACGCEADMKTLGYHVIYFDVDTQDYLNDDPSLIHNSEAIFQQAFNNMDAQGGPDANDALVIAHDIHNQTSKVLVEYMLQTVRAYGYRTVTLGECLGDPKANWYRS